MPKSEFKLFLAVCFVILLIFGSDPTKNPIDYESGSDLIEIPLVAGPHIPISINGNTELATFITNEGLSGLGTYVSPYIIEDYTINASTANGIHIQNTNKYLIVRNCTVFDGNISTYYGIYLSNVMNMTLNNNTLNNNVRGIYLSSSTNNTLTGNTLILNTQIGINLENSNNNTLYGNNVSYSDWNGIKLESSSNNTLLVNNVNNNAQFGIQVSSSSNNILVGNNASYNTNYGIYLWYSNNNTLSGNTASHNDDHGILMHSSHYNTLAENTAIYSGYSGMRVDVSSNNTISWNNASFNSGNGIYLPSSSDNTFLGNTAFKNTWFGIKLDESSNNTFYFNVFLENTDGTADCIDSLGNSWDNGTHGNYWGDYPEKYPAATNNLIIWDTPYQMDATNIDYLPLVTINGTEGDNANPTISHPIDKDFIVGSLGNTLEWTINDMNVQDPTYSIYLDGAQIDSGSLIPGNPITINLDGLPMGIYNLTIMALDGLGENVSDSVKVTVWNERGLITHSPIFIDGDGGANDWDTFPNKTGSGTYSDPYIIENLEINGGGTESGLLIRDSASYVIIRNCTIVNSTFGIILIYANNITLGENYLENNTNGIYINHASNNSIDQNEIFNNDGTGIILSSSFNNTVLHNSINNSKDYGLEISASSFNNTISSNGIKNSEKNGIYIASSSENRIINNTISFNLEKGIELMFSSGNHILGNIIQNNNEYGISIYPDSNSTVVDNNLIADNVWTGIRIDSSYNEISDNYLGHNGGGISMVYGSQENQIFRNNITENSGNAGIEFVNSGSGTMVYLNRIYNNTRGFSISLSNNNLFFNNQIFDNIYPNFVQDGTINSWDNGVHGNYWGDYQEKYPAATNNLTIWNTPYEIDSNNTDYFPLVTIYGTASENTNPTISHPEDINFVVGSVGNNLEWTISDITIQNPTYIVYQDGIQIEDDSWIPENPISINLDPFSNGVYNLSISVLDGLGGYAFDSVTLMVGVLPDAPIWITANQTIIFNNITVSWIAVDGATSYNVYVDGILNETTSGTAQKVMLHLNGTYSITVTAVNASGESANSTAIFVTVELPPDIDTETNTDTNTDDESDDGNNEGIPLNWNIVWLILTIGLGVIGIYKLVQSLPGKKNAPFNIICPHCGNYCSPDAKSCPQCGDPLKKRRKRKKKKESEPTIL